MRRRRTSNGGGDYGRREGERLRGRDRSHSQAQQRSHRPVLWSLLDRWNLSRRQQAAIVVGIGLLFGAWFLTPLSDWTASLVLLAIPMDSDVELGREALRSLERSYPPVADAWGVSKVGWDLVSSTTSVDATEQAASATLPHWSFGVIHADFVNAFALPGGIVRVTDALLRQLELTDGELGALIGHEMGHVLHRHSQRRLVKQRLISTLLSALVYEDNDGHQESFGEAVGELLLKSASWLGEMHFSRNDEYQADSASWQILLASQRYNPKSLQALLAKLWSLEGSSSGRTSWESTHPGTRDRIDALQTKWDDLPKRRQRSLDLYTTI